MSTSTVRNTPPLTDPAWLIYWQLTRFLFPLAITAIIREVSSQFLNGGMARISQATQTLAGFGLAFGLTLFLAAILLQAKQLSLVLVDGRPAYRKVNRFVLVSGAILAAIVAGLAFDPLHEVVIKQLHGIEAPLSNVVREALLWLVPVPIIFGTIWFHSGLLLRVRRTDIVSYATLTSIAANGLAVFGLLPLALVQARPVLLPILALYAGLLTELIILLWGYWRFVGPAIDHLQLSATPSVPHLTYGYIVQFFWPLALIMGVQGFSRPLINLFISREANPTEALAVLTVVYTLGRIPYGWLNDLRNIAPAFLQQTGTLRPIRLFVAGCALVSVGIMFLLFWTPLRIFILQSLIGLDRNLVDMARTPLLIFTLFPIVVAARAYFHGIGLVEHRTRMLAPSGPARILSIFIALILLPYFGVYGASRGVAALLIGFIAESVAVWLRVRDGR